MNKLLESLDPYTTEEIEPKHLIFRNYVPRSPQLKPFIVQAATTVAEIELNTEREIRQSLKDFELQQKEPLTIVPKKANWDLKRSYERKMEKMNKKTEEAISKLIKLNKK